MKRALLALLVFVGVVTLAPSPAEAAHGADVWDAAVRYWGPQTGGGFTDYWSLRVKISVPAAQETGSRFRLCMKTTRSNPSQTAFTGGLLADVVSGMSTTADGYQALETLIDQQNSPTMALVWARIIQHDATCNDSATGLPLGAHGGATDIPTDNLVLSGTAAQPTVLPNGQEALPTDTDCARSLQQINGENVAQFTANESQTGYTDTWAWDFGDGGTATTREPDHVYGSLATAPEGGWIAVVTITRTGDGTLYPVGPETLECELRVDFLNPDQSQVGSPDQEQEDSDCPSGWGFLNPLAFVKTLKCLFVPTEFDTEAVSESFSEAFPFDWLGETYSASTALLDRFQEEVDNDGSGGCHNRPGITAPLSGVGGEDITIRLPLPDAEGCASGMVEGSAPTDIDAEVGDLWGMHEQLRLVLKVMLYVGFVWWAIRRSPWGRNEDGVGGDL